MQSPENFPLELADRCVKCGLCLPHCPTYGLSNVEGESPRGRIALMQGLAMGRLDAAPTLVGHLESCLGCRACEAVCPADVPYGELIDAGRALLARHGARPPLARRALSALLQQPRLLAAALAAARIPGSRAVARVLGGVPARTALLLPRDARRPSTDEVQPNAGATRGEALLFTGCVGGAVDGPGLDAIRRALAAAGWRVRMPPRQACCGAIDLHAGRPAEARQLALRNLAAFPGDGPIVACASGCAATLKEYARLAGDEGAALAARVRDPVELLADAGLPLRPGPYRKIVLHVPCTQRNVTGTAAVTRRLLAQLPGVVVRELPAGCCGAAGEMFISHPAMSDALLEPLLDDLAGDPPDALVTSNIGCALHFSAGLARRGVEVPVLHPAALVAGALECAP
jgi:glycolate oxidase iron-sulfur subunit